MLATQSFGMRSELPNLVIAHGLFGSARNWRAIAKRLSRDRQVLTVDMRNHGDSFRAETQSYDDMANDLALVVSQMTGPVDLMGHSMGGKSAMMLACKELATINRLIVVDIAPVAYTHSQADNIHAMMQLPLGDISSRGDADELLATSVSDPTVRAFLLQSLNLSPGGHNWKLNLPVLKKFEPQIVGFPNELHPYLGECLFVRGGSSEYVAGAHWNAAKELFPNAELITVEAAGHWVHAEATRAFLNALEAYL